MTNKELDELEKMGFDFHICSQCFLIAPESLKAGLEIMNEILDKQEYHCLSAHHRDKIKIFLGNNNREEE